MHKSMYPLGVMYVQTYVCNKECFLVQNISHLSPPNSPVRIKWNWKFWRQMVSDIWAMGRPWHGNDKVLHVLNSALILEDVLGSGSTVPRILFLGTRWRRDFCYELMKIFGS